MPFVYILYSQKIDKFYVGITIGSIDARIQKHNQKFYNNKWTHKGIPWSLFHSIQCHSKSQTLAIEKHIKKMKSRIYYHNLKKYPEMTIKLKLRYP